MAHDGNGEVLGQEGRDCGAQSSHNTVLLGGDEAAGLFGSGEQGLAIQGLYGVEVQDAGGDSLGLEQFRRGQRALDHEAGGADGEVLALAQLGGLSELKLVARDGVCDVSTACGPV